MALRICSSRSTAEEVGEADAVVAEALTAAVAAAVAAEEAAAAVVVTDLTAHLGDRLTVNWQWRLIGLL